MTWESGRFLGPVELVAKISSHLEKGADLYSFSKALTLIGKALDEVERLQVDDGHEPWDFDAHPIRPMSAKRRRMYLDAAADSLPAIA